MKVFLVVLAFIVVLGSCNLSQGKGGSSHLVIYSGGSKSLHSYVKSDIPVVLDTYDSFGKDVALSEDGNVVAVSADQFDNKGAVFVFEWNGNAWEQTKIDHPSHSGYFGYSIALSSDGTILAVGSPGDADFGARSGSVSVFEKNLEWELMGSIIFPSDCAENMFFGSTVGLSQDGLTLAVAAEHWVGVGTAYVFKWTGSDWVESVKFVDPSGVDWHYFGSSVAISGDGNFVLVGGYQAKEAYLYRWDNSAWAMSIIPQPGTELDDYGFSVSMSHDCQTLAIGAKRDDDKGFNNGAAYVYKWNGASWDETKLLPDSGSWNMGWSVSVSGDGSTVAVGESNATYAFDTTTWERQKLIPFENISLYACNVAVDLDGSDILVGAFVQP